LSSVPRSSAGRLAARSLILFLNFFLIILAYYQVKSASRSLLIEYWGADAFAYVWIASALVLISVILVYHRLVARLRRFRVILGSCLLSAAAMAGFWSLLQSHPAVAALGFYIFVDIISVILVEEFWSLTDTVTAGEEGRKSYWFVSTGGLAGSVVGGATALALLKYTSLETADLLLSAAAILVLIFFLNLRMGGSGMFVENAHGKRPLVAREGWRALTGSRYLFLIAGALFFAQLAQPVVEYQFLKKVEALFPEMDPRTEFISGFFSALGFISIGVNLVVTPLIHRYLGIIVGMMLQPVLLFLFSLGFLLQSTLLTAAAMKVSDRGLSYSINRASKEQLYIPVAALQTYQAKAWIDMLGYRIFKMVGSVLILLFTQWLPALLDAGEWWPFTLDIGQMSWLTLLICAGWMALLLQLKRCYESMAQPLGPQSSTRD
jgi:AAA family ATP:ADP antiporter